MTTVITMMDDDLFAASVRPNKTLATVDWRLDLNPEIRDCDIPLDMQDRLFRVIRPILSLWCRARGAGFLLLPHINGSAIATLKRWNLFGQPSVLHWTVGENPMKRAKLVLIAAAALAGAVALPLAATAQGIGRGAAGGAAAGGNAAGPVGSVVGGAVGGVVGGVAGGVKGVLGVPQRTGYRYYPYHRYYHRHAYYRHHYDHRYPHNALN
jgi:hypothetical protein